MRNINALPIFLIILLSFTFNACSTPQHQALRKVEVGMTKADVLELAGSPRRTGREHNQDLWTYEIDSNSGKEITYIYLKDGKVTYIGAKADADSEAHLNKTKPSQYKTIGE